MKSLTHGCAFPVDLREFWHVDFIEFSVGISGFNENQKTEIIGLSMFVRVQ